MSDNEQTHLETEKNAAVKGQVADQAEGQVEDNVEDKAEDKVEDKAEVKVEAQVKAKVEGKLGAEVTEPVIQKVTAEPVAEKTARAKAESSTKANTQAPSAAKRSLPWASTFFVLCIVSLSAALAYVVDQGQKLLQQQTQEISALENNLNTSHKNQIQSLKQYELAQKKVRDKLATQLQQTQTDLSDMSQRLSAQNRRISSLTDTSRDDWLLAEAEYLLKLANQRVRIERSPDGAEALLEDADAILRDLDDPNLHILRRAIAKDLAALRLLQKIDVEGIYLNLLALTGEIGNIPVRPIASIEEQTVLAEINNTPAPSKTSAWQTVTASWGRFTQSFKSFVRVVHHDKKPKALLPVQDGVYLQQNLRLMLERAQLALLREQQDIFAQSLSQADIWLQEYYNTSPTLEAFRQQLKNLGGKTVVQVLPDISASLALIHEYITNLHKLDGLKLDVSELSGSKLNNVSVNATSNKSEAETQP